MLPQLEKNNEMQDGILNGILSQVDNAYIEKTEQSNVIHLDGSGDGVSSISLSGDTVLKSAEASHIYMMKELSRQNSKSKRTKCEMCQGNTSYSEYTYVWVGLCHRVHMSGCERSYVSQFKQLAM